MNKIRFEGIAALWVGLCLVAKSAFGLEPKNFEFHSQAYQDQFVHFVLYELLDKRDKGYYLEIGGGDPLSINNSHFFEKTYDWDGISIDIDGRYEAEWKAVRKNPLRIEDARALNYLEILSDFPKWIDYLSLDIDRDYDQVLKKIPFEEYAFKIITIEHDFYHYGDRFRKEERAILSRLGYHLLCADVSLDGNMYEDWWIHPDAIPANLFSSLIALDLNQKPCESILRALHECFKSF